MNNISCNIIKDLLPLYYDKICSIESNKIVEDHIVACNSCQSELEKIKTSINIPKEIIEESRSDYDNIKNIAALWKRSKVKAFFKGLGISIVCMLIYLSHSVLFDWPITNVPINSIEITDVCKLKDGIIAYHVEITDGYELNNYTVTQAEDGNCYVTPHRPILKKKDISNNYSLNNMYYLFDESEYTSHQEIKGLYYGTQKDNILIWKKGMDLPKASESVEKICAHQK